MSHRFDEPRNQESSTSGTNALDQVGPVRFETHQGHGGPYSGCLIALVLLGISVLLVLIVYRQVTRQIRQEVETSTDSAPEPVPVVEMPEERRQEIIQRANAFERAVRTFPGEKASHFLTDEQRTLVLTGEELNVLIEQTPELKGHFFVTLDDDLIKAQVSLPLDALPGLQGRYFNGEAEVIAFVASERPAVHIRNLRVKKNKLPRRFRALIMSLNIVPALFADKDASPPAALAHGFEKIEIEDGKLIVVALSAPNQEATSGQPPEGRVEWQVEEGGNGHFYELVRHPKHWIDANEDARQRTHKGMTGHLATITSAAENAFLRDRVAVNEIAWIGLTNDPNFGGGESQDHTDPKRGGWIWVTGEPVTFMAWSEDAPSHGGDHRNRHFAAFNGAFGTRRGEWDHLEENPDGGRFSIVEYEPERADQTK